MPKLSPEQLHSLAKASELRKVSLLAYHLPAADQRKVWLVESDEAHRVGDRSLSQDRWLVDVCGIIDAVNPAAPIYLLADDLRPAEHAGELSDAVQQEATRIVMWREYVAFYGCGSCAAYFAGTSRYMSFLGGPWSDEVKGMLQLSFRPAESRQLSTNERFGISRARFQPRRQFYYVANTRYEAAQRPAKGGHHASPVAHDRSAHRALLTRVSIEPDEQQDLEARHYRICVTEALPTDVLDRMTRRGKQAVPGALNAYRWIDKSAARVNPEGEPAQRVTVIR